MAFTEEELKQIEDLFEKYYRRKYPTFEVTGGGPTSLHDDAEYALTTNEQQILHFYKGGVGKLASNSCLLYTSPSPRDRISSRMPSSA